MGAVVLLLLMFRCNAGKYSSVGTQDNQREGSSSTGLERISPMVQPLQRTTMLAF